MFKKIKRYCPLYTLPFFIFAIAAGICHIAARGNTSLAEKLNGSIGYAVRFALAKVSGTVPFSIAEGIVMLLPIVVAALIVYVLKGCRGDIFKISKLIFILLAVICLLYTLFVFTLVLGYNTETADVKLELSKVDYGEYELHDTASWLNGNMNGLIDEIAFKYHGSSVMPYSFADMNEKLNEAYAKASEKYPFIKNFSSRVKPIILSEPMTYTHISGIYSYFTGESNINTNFPDYTTAYTAAHEMAHQRGFAREDEANFMAFLVCAESDDPYIKYSGYLSAFEYVIADAYALNKDMYSAVMRKTDDRVRYEMIAYNDFFDKYKENTAADISSAMNDAYIKSQGESAGEKSYEMVTKFIVAYYKTYIENQK